MGEDWLDIKESEYPAYPVVLKLEEGKPADAGVPGLDSQAVLDAEAAREKRAQFILSWESLSEAQRVFLNTWRECRFNMSRALRVLAGTAHGYSKTSVLRWADDPRYVFVRDLLRDASVEEILKRNYLAARHEDIVETAMTPTPILHQGVATGHFEVELGVAAKANETLLKLGGHLKDKDVELNVGIVGPSFVIQVVQPDNTVTDITPRGVPVQLPEPEPVIEADFEESTEWLDGP